MNEQDNNIQNTSAQNTENKFNSQTQSTETNKSFPTFDDKSREVKPANDKSNSDSLNVDSAKETAKDVYNQAKDTAGQAYGVATKRATEAITEKKGDLAGGLTSVAESIKQVGENLRDAENQNQITETAAKYGDTVANQIEKVSAYFENKDVSEMVSDAERFARRNPALFIGAAFGIGFLAARFLKSSPTNRKSNYKSRVNEESANSFDRSTDRKIAANPS